LLPSTSRPQQFAGQGEVVCRQGDTGLVSVVTDTRAAVRHGSSQPVNPVRCNPHGDFGRYIFVGHYARYR
jgi:hypothetical protein